jgi:hypothetical protein
MIQTDHGAKTMHSLNRVTLIFLFATCPLTLSVDAQQGDQSSKDKGIVAALSLREATQCADTKTRDIEVNVAVTNTSASDIVLRRGLWQNVSVLGLFGTKTLSPLLQSWSSAADAGPGSTATEVTIHPGNTFAYPVHLRLDADVLKQPGFYEVRVSYDALRPTGTERPRNIGGLTNEAIFQVRECGDLTVSERPENATNGAGNMSCQVPVPHALQDASFTVVYKFETKDGKPVNIRKVKNDFLPDSKFVACISRWTIPGTSQGVATFSRKPAEGWTTSVSGEGTDVVDLRSSH